MTKNIKEDATLFIIYTSTAEQKEYYSQASLEQQAGEQWLERRAKMNGFKVHLVIASGYINNIILKRVK